MSRYVNELNQPIGFPLPQWSDCERPSDGTLQGQYCKLVRLNVEAHAADLFSAFSKDSSHMNWTYLPYGPFEHLSDFKTWLKGQARSLDPFFYTVINLENNTAVGMASYLRIEPKVGSIEVGHIHFSPLMQRTPVATEAMFLMMKNVFDVLGYRRYEWKCDALNEPSKNAAKRFGFTFEGIFRQATIYKNRNRDTAWLSVIDREWPWIRTGFEAWLTPENFDDQGRQKQRLNTQSKA